MFKVHGGESHGGAVFTTVSFFVKTKNCLWLFIKEYEFRQPNGLWNKLSKGNTTSASPFKNRTVSFLFRIYLSFFIIPKLDRLSAKPWFYTSKFPRWLAQFHRTRVYITSSNVKNSRSRWVNVTTNNVNSMIIINYCNLEVLIWTPSFISKNHI